MPPTGPPLVFRLTPLLVVGLLATAPARAAQVVRPNIVVVVLDDFGTDLVGAYGEATDPPPTPRLDQLAQNGVLFRRVWTHPVCSPSRASILTGRHAFRTGIGAVIGSDPDEPGLPLSETTLPELLDTGGEYVHAAFGKWHLSSATGPPLAPNLAGFGHYDGCLSNLDIVPSRPWSYDHWPRVVDGVESISSDYLTTATVDAALGWIQAAPEPWFAYVAFHAVHSPSHWPPASLHSVDPGQVPPGQLAKQQHRAMVESLDREVGRLLDGLVAAGPTTVIVIGDNGTAGPGVEAPFPADHGKHTLYDGGVRVPLLISGAEVRARGECDALVQGLDLFATVAELAGVDAAAAGVTLDSISLVPYLADPAAPSQRAVTYSERFGPNGPGAGQPLPNGLFGADPGLPPLCQSDLGFGGPGPAPPVLGLCGDGGQAPVAGNLVTVAVAGAQPTAPGFLLLGQGAAPTPFIGGQLVPAPLLGYVPFTTDASGAWSLTVPGDILGVFDSPQVVAQVLAADGTLPTGQVLSNAISVDVLPFDRKAIEDQDGYKFVITAYGGKQELYDRSVDPFEQHDLLATGEAALSPTATAHLGFLRGQMIALLAAP